MVKFKKFLNLKNTLSRSPYGVSKLYAYWITKNYREAYNIFASNGILFNHESPLRGETFVTRKITIAVSKIVLGLQNKLKLGNLDSKRDWGHAKDYVRMMWLILQHNSAEDWVIATGKAKSVRDFVKLAFNFVGIELEFTGNGIEEKGVIKCFTKNKTDFKFNNNLKIGDCIIEVDPFYFRPTEVDLLIGDSSKAKKILNWEPIISLEELVKEMVISDLSIQKNLND